MCVCVAFRRVLLFSTLISPGFLSLSLFAGFIAWNKGERGRKDGSVGPCWNEVFRPPQGRGAEEIRAWNRGWTRGERKSVATGAGIRKRCERSFFFLSRARGIGIVNRRFGESV